MSMNEWIIVDLENFHSAHTTTGLMMIDHGLFSDCEFPNIHTHTHTQTALSIYLQRKYRFYFWKKNRYYENPFNQSIN